MSPVTELMYFSLPWKKKFLVSLHSAYFLKSTNANFKACNNIKILGGLFEVQCNVQFMLIFGVELPVKNEGKKPLACRPLRAHSTRITPRCYVINFRPRKLGPPLTKSWIRTWKNNSRKFYSIVVREDITITNLLILKRVSFR